MSEEETNQWAGRTKRHIWIVCGGIIMILALGSFSIGGLIYILCNYSEQIPPLAILVSLVAVVLTLSSVTHSLVGLIVANDNIFCSSGKPIEMARSLYESFFLQSQTFLAILVVGIISVLLITNTIKPSEGLPIVTGAVGFALGRQFNRNKKEE
jgi:hypothetical protein